MPAGPSAIVGQNWDNDPVLNDFTVVLTRRPAGKPALMNITQAGLIAYMGFNNAGIGLCLNTLPAPCSRPGQCRTFIARPRHLRDHQPRATPLHGGPPARPAIPPTS